LSDLTIYEFCGCLTLLKLLFGSHSDDRIAYASKLFRLSMLCFAVNAVGLIV